MHEHGDESRSSSPEITHYHKTGTLHLQPHPIVKVEDVYEQLGGFSRFQFFATIIILCLEIPGAMVALSPILTSTTHVDFFCVTNGSYEIIPRDELCTTECNGEVKSREPYISIVQEWNLICEKAWISDALTSVFMTGSAMGPLVTAQVADRFGRKPAFYMICVLLSISGIFASLSTSVTMYAASKFFSGVAAGGCMVAHMNYLMEFLTPSWRIICGCVSMWPVGEMLLALAGFLYPAWRTLSWVSILPAVFLIITFPYLPESPRWLLAQSQTAKAERILKEIARRNNRSSIPWEELQRLQSSILTSENEKNHRSASDRWKTFKEPKILMTINIFFLAWFANALTYYGISYNMKNMGGNPYLNVFLLGVLDAPAELFGMFFSNRFGRKTSFIGFLIVSLMCLVSVAGIKLLPDSYDLASFEAVVLVLCLAGRFFNETSFAIMTCFTGESFPTIIRSMAFSICTIASSVGGIIAPQMSYLGTVWSPGPYIVFAVTCIISSILSLKLKETKKKPLVDVN